MLELKLEKEMIKIAKKLKKSGKVNYCKKGCINCLIAEAKGKVDKKFGFEMSSCDFSSGIFGFPSMITDYIMLDLIEKVKEGKIKI